MGAILDFVPEEEKQVVTSMTTQALYYLPAEGLKHKVLAVVEDEGSNNASYPLKILQSEKKLILAVTVRDPEGGMPKTELKTVEGPVAQFMTSTQAEFDEELANRYLVLSVDEDREQTRRIHAAQREEETLAGMLRRIEREEVLRTHHNAQRLLRPLRVVNPHAVTLSFPDDQLRLRRDHKKYLGLIRVIAFLRQYQKPIRSCEHRGKTIQYIEVDEHDLRLAHDLAAQVLCRSLDELAPPTRTFLAALEMVVESLQKERKVSRDRVRLPAVKCGNGSSGANPRCAAISTSWRPWNMWPATGFPAPEHASFMNCLASLKAWRRSPLAATGTNLNRHP